ncbi:MAG: sulfatase-like hydrolase/transferase, partial [Planctomycetes bacterium]|nr:sulfatase-like hydrolase/transferase [Planctomycetota bacterium]
FGASAAKARPCFGTLYLSAEGLRGGSRSKLDRCLGRIRKYLTDRGLDGTTAVVLTAPRGLAPSPGNPAPDVGSESATRVPAFVRLPGALAAGQRFSFLARSVDLMPTLLELLGHSELRRSSNIDGVSLDRGMFGGAEPSLAAFVESGLAEGELELTLEPRLEGMLVVSDEHLESKLEHKSRMMRTRRWKLLKQTPRELRLYDMITDPRQTLDLSRLGLVPGNHLMEAMERWITYGTPSPWFAPWDEPR